MVAENGFHFESSLSTPSTPLDDADTADYTTLKRSLSRIHRPSRLSNNLPTPSLHESTNHDFRQRPFLSPSSSAMHLHIPQPPVAAETALAALHHLPTPLIVLSSLKTIVLANEAMGRLLGLRDADKLSDGGQESITDVLKGQTLSQIGIDMVSDGVPIW